MERLATLAREEPLFALGLDGIEAWRSATASLVLTRAASERLVATRAGPRSAGIEKGLALQERLGWGNPVERALQNRPFVVLAGDEMVYGGIFLDLPSQMAIDYPVIRTTIEQGRVVFAVLPLHLPFFETDPAADPTSGEARGPEGDVPQGMMATFRAAALSPEAVALRARVNDPRLRASLEAAGKWR